jgi:hypothetical protein
MENFPIYLMSSLSTAALSQIASSHEAISVDRNVNLARPRTHMKNAHIEPKDA